MHALRRYFETKLEKIVTTYLAEFLKNFDIKVTVLFQPKDDKSKPE